MRRRSVRARQAPHRPGRPIPLGRPGPKPRWWSWPTRLPLKEEITGSNPVRGTSTAGGDHPVPTGGAPADVVERRHAGPKTRCREAWGWKSPRRHNASRPGGPPAFVPPGPGVDTPGRLWPPPTGQAQGPQAEVMERRHASLRSWCLSGACECKSRLPHQGGSVTVSRASCAGAYPPLVPAVAGVGTPRRLWSARPTGNAEVVER